MPAAHKVPTHMGMPDKIVFGLTAKQLLMALIGCSLGYDIWLHLYPLMAYGPGGMVARLIFALVPAGGVLALGLISLAGRPLDVWVLVALRYAFQPKTYVWRSIRHTTLTAEREERKGQKAARAKGAEVLRVPAVQLRERG